MTIAVCICVFILFLGINDAQLTLVQFWETQLIFELEGGLAEFQYSTDNLMPLHCGMYGIQLVWVSEDGDHLVMNCRKMREYLENVYCECGVMNNSVLFAMKNLSVSQSGHYRIKFEILGTMNVAKNFYLIVGAEADQNVYVKNITSDSTVELCKLDSTLENGSFLQLYRSTILPDWKSDSILVLDTNFSLEPLLESLRGRLQVDLNNSVVTLSGITQADTDFYCLKWSAISVPKL